MALLQIAIAVDQMANALAGGWADETLSARAWRRQTSSRRWRWVRAAIDSIFFWQPSHCRAAFEAERARRHLPPQYRTSA